jgi:hypothetical protein
MAAGLSRGWARRSNAKKGFRESVFYASSYITEAVWRNRFSHLKRVVSSDSG